MKIPILILLSFVSLCAHGQGTLTFVYDQQSANETTPGGAAGPISSNQPIGQSFTPSFSSIDFVRFALGDTTLNDLGATLRVNLRLDSITGNVLASTDPVFMPDNSFGYINFLFPSSVLVNPGTVYYLQPEIVSGDEWAIVGYNTYNYTGGMAFYQGVARPTQDLWFREGTIVPVPEPSSIALLIIAAGFAAMESWRRRNRNKKTRPFRVAGCSRDG
jgi:hypothetical protein